MLNEIIKLLGISMLHKLQWDLMFVTEIHEHIDIKLPKWLVRPLLSNVAQNLVLPSEHELKISLMFWIKLILDVFVELRVFVT